MEIDPNHYIFQTLCGVTALLCLVIAWLGRGVFKRLDKIDDKLEPLRERVSMSELKHNTLLQMHDKLEGETRAAHDKIFLKLDSHERLIQEIREHKK